MRQNGDAWRGDADDCESTPYGYGYGVWGSTLPKHAAIAHNVGAYYSLGEGVIL